MAATVSSVWSKPGAWALDSEENDAEQQLMQKTEQKTYSAAKANGAGPVDAASDFPSLAAAASTKTKKKKPPTMSLFEFSNKPAVYQKPVQTLTHEDLMSLPTGPRERTAEELDRSKLGGGFRSYGMGRDSESSSSKWGARVSDDMPRRQDRELAPSRADEVDDWGASKKSVSSNGFDRRERGGERGERGGFFGSESRADESDNWGAKKSFVPTEGRRERRVVGFESSGGADSGNWLRKKEEEGGRKVVGGGAFDSLRERRGGLDSNSNGGLDSESWGKKRGEEGIGGVRPRLNLQPRTLPVVSQQNNGGGGGVGVGVVGVGVGVGVVVGGGGGAPVVKPKGSNPFGEARPREEVLKEKGQDWKEIDEKLGKRSLSFGSGSGSGRATSPEERSWRKAESADVRPSSADNVEGDLDHVEGDVAEEAEETQG